MKCEEGILLYSQFNNLLTAGGQLGWFPLQYNPSTGYTWRFIPDGSGVYELAGEITLLPSTLERIGAPGMKIWKFRPARKGTGAAVFALYPPGSEIPEQTIAVRMTVG